MQPTGSVDMKGVTQEEVSKLTKAMKDQQFRDHMDEYVKEISDPAHRKEYLDYLDQIEAKGEVPDGQRLLRCEPGLCVKTTILFKNGQSQKCFINIVHSPQLEDFTTVPDKGGQRIHVPHVLSPPRPDQDNKKGTCLTCDLAVSTRTFLQAAQNSQILKLLVDTAADGLGSHFLKGFEEVKKDYKVMQRMRSKGGAPMPMSVKAERLKDGGKPTKGGKKSGQDAVTPGELRKMRADAKERMKQEQAEDEEEEEEEPEKPVSKKTEEVVTNRIRVPKHSLLHSGTVDLTDYMEASSRPSLLPTITVPKLLKLTVELPTVKQVGDITLEVTPNNIVVEVPNKFYLDMPLSYEVDEGRGKAKFDKTKQVLTLELPVCPKPPDPEMLATLERFSKPVQEQGGDVSEEEEDADDALPPLEDPEEGWEKVDADPVGAAAMEAEGAEPSSTATDAIEPPRERLEFGESTGALQIMQDGPQVVALEEPVASEVSVLEDDAPDFIPAAEFAGRRPGYYFSQGEEGLGYYRDLKQATTKKVETSVEVSPPDLAKAPLVEEVLTSTAPATSSTAPALVKPQRRLPPHLRDYVDISTLLLARVPAHEEVQEEGAVEPSMSWRQTRQNVMLVLTLPSNVEVTGLSVALEDRRLGVAFCQRPVMEDQSSSKWQHQRVRRVFCRDSAVDVRQWHASLRRQGGSTELIITLRKVDAEVWDEAFDAAAVLLPVSEDSLVSLHRVRPRADDRGQKDAAHGDAALDETHQAAGGGDMMEPQKVDPSGPSVPIQGAGADALKQSAIGMGQAVLLQSRLLYQLL
mmetsp:Transcript_2169/g.5514  ORF Transcript_2169/g.5514 Transcript_2169/m.5514 type:complete len:803 (+) Transcript_2169:74-2482(+)